LKSKSLWFFALFLSACFLENPVKETPALDERGYNEWILSRLYLYPEDLPQAFTADSIQALYAALSDPYTRYIPPAKAPDAEQGMNTSIIPGDIGVEIYLNAEAKYPLFLYRIYPDAPAGRAGVPRYSRLVSVNGTELSGDDAYNAYLKVMKANKEITLTVENEEGTQTFSLVKETVYAPTVFVDTLPQAVIITIREFTLTTSDHEKGTLGEFQKILEEADPNVLKVIDIRNNPGGHISQCVNAADLLVERGILSIRFTNQMTPDGKKQIKKTVVNASAGGIGENGNFVLAINRYTASCGEIFATAIAENTSIPLIGETTYGKGIGQSVWKTPAGGDAVITGTQFLTPNGVNYHQQGIPPDIFCENASLNCILNAAGTPAGALLTKKEYVSLRDILMPPRRILYGALEEGENECVSF
jgi:C-terminal peptidase prc